MMASEIYAQTADGLMNLMARMDALNEFRAMMLARAEVAARDIIRMGLDEPTFGELRGQISICYELADKAEKALEAQRAQANAQNAEGFPIGAV